MSIEVVPQSQHTGAEIRGVTLSPDLDDATVAEIRAALLQWKVVFFRDQDLDRDRPRRARVRGSVRSPRPIPRCRPGSPTIPEIVVIQKDAHGHDDPDETILEHRWHSDVTYTPDAADGVDPASRGAAALRRRHRVVQPGRRLRGAVRAAQDDDRRSHRDPPQRAPPRARASPTSCRRTSSPYDCGPATRSCRSTRKPARRSSTSIPTSPATSTSSPAPRASTSWPCSTTSSPAANSPCASGGNPGSVAMWDNRVTAHRAPLDVPRGPPPRDGAHHPARRAARRRVGVHLDPVRAPGVMRLRSADGRASFPDLGRRRVALHPQTPCAADLPAYSVSVPERPDARATGAARSPEATPATAAVPLHPRGRRHLPGHQRHEPDHPRARAARRRARGHPARSGARVPLVARRGLRGRVGHQA